MRLSKVKCVGPSGVTFDIEAHGEHGLEVRPIEGAEMIAIYDCKEKPESPTWGDSNAVCEAVIPATWAFFYEWQITEAPPRS
jgi:hypothetical protein